MILRAEHIVKRYKRRTVVGGVSMQVEQGEIVGLLGPNGAGKTTSFYMIVGLVKPNEGRVFLDGDDITDLPMYKRAQKGIGYLPQEASVFRKLSVEDNIKAILEMTKLSKAEQHRKLESLLDEFGLGHVRKNMGDVLSGGERRRTEIARALATEPKFILLDEPFAGVDPIAVEDIQGIVSQLKKRNIGVLITDHNVQETLSITDRAYLLFEGKILYVGKATSLRSRVGSYFVKNHHDGKTRVLVSHITDLRTIVVETPYDALLLESSLIKEYQPRYNILLRDDKSYPWIRIRNEHYPRIEGMRNPEDDGSEYFGPFASVRAMRTLLKLVHKLYKLRTCNYDLSPANLAKGKYKRCLEYHLGNCRAPCEGLQDEAEYNANVAQARQLVKGRIRGVVRLLKEQMHAHAEKLEFEEAEEVRDQLEQLEKYQARSTVVNPDIGDVDVYGLARNTFSTFVNYLRVIDGAVVQGITIELKRKLDEPDDEVLQLAIAELRQRYRSNAPKAIVPMR